MDHGGVGRHGCFLPCMPADWIRQLAEARFSQSGSFGVQEARKGFEWKPCPDTLMLLFFLALLTFGNFGLR